MIDRDVLHGDIVLIQHSGFENTENGKIVVIERLGDEEGTGAWSLKQLIFEKAGSSSRSEFGDEFDFENPSITLRSHNPRCSPRPLDPSGR